MLPARRVQYTYGQYLRALADSRVRFEYLDGEIFAIPGGTAGHAEIAGRVIGLLGSALTGCSIFTSDLKVRIEATDLSTFPDVSVVCGPHQFSTIDKQALTNPQLLVEVTSKSTEHYDRDAKLAHYKHLASLQAVLLVSHRNPRITLVRRTPDGWITTDHGPGDVVQLESPALSLPVDEVFAGIALEID